jgi:hypothetical protein
VVAHHPGRLIAGTPWLDVFCPGCGTSRAIDLRTVDRHPLASVGTLVLGLRCSWCRIDRLGRLAIERDALVMGKHGPAVERCHLPRPEQAERVLDRPVHCCGDLVGDTQRQWTS